MGSICSPETSVLSHLTPRNNPEIVRIQWNKFRNKDDGETVVTKRVGSVTAEANVTTVEFCKTESKSLVLLQVNCRSVCTNHWSFGV
jgi:hypothetical protein